MQQLGSLDNLMIGGANMPLHIAAVLLYDTGGKRGARRLYEALQANFPKAVDLHFPILRCRIDEVALQLDNAYWVEDKHFSLSSHISRVALPKPRNWEELYRLIGQFHAEPLNRSRPLWQVLLVEDLDELDEVPRGCTAVFFKIHHAVMDGKSAIRLASSLHSLSPEPGAPLLAESMAIEEPVEKAYRAPSGLSKYTRAWWHSVERPADLATTLLKNLPQLWQSDIGAVQARQSVPQLRFNHPVAADRVTGHVRLNMKKLRRLERKYHCTINDIALCVIGGGLRQYLLEQDELPEQDLQTLIPIDIRREDKDGHAGNHVSVARLNLYTVLADPKERLLAISDAASHAKKGVKRGKPPALLKLVDAIHPALILGLGQRLVEAGLLDRMPQIVNTVVTNVPGMHEDVYLGGAKLIDYLGFGPLAPNMGLFHTVSSTPDHVNITFLTTEEFMGDGSAYRAALATSCSEVTGL